MLRPLALPRALQQPSIAEKLAQVCMILTLNGEGFDTTLCRFDRYLYHRQSTEGVTLDCLIVCVAEHPQDQNQCCSRYKPIETLGVEAEADCCVAAVLDKKPRKTASSIVHIILVCISMVELTGCHRCLSPPEIEPLKSPQGSVPKHGRMSSTGLDGVRWVCVGERLLPKKRDNRVRTIAHSSSRQQCPVT